MTPRFNAQLAGAKRAGGPQYESWIFGAGLTREQIDRARRWLIVASVLALIIGTLSILVPVIASVTAAIFVGWILLAAGIAVAIHAISHRAPVRGLEALISLVAGFYLLAFPLRGAVTLTFVLAVWFVARGILTLTYAIQRRGLPGSSIYALGGILSVILGFVIAASLPSSGTWAIGLLVGVDLIFWGVRTMVSAHLLSALKPPT
jgi:uncharacterized membrane protein HdeD (DUF308 family)